MKTLTGKKWWIMGWFLGGIIVLVLAFTVVPLVLTRVFGLGVWKRGRSRDAIALTFDDGPDPAYTPRLLEMLKRHGVRATFFVLGSKAERHPELIRQMQADGHAIGIHGYEHLPNWLLTPWTVKRHVERTADIVERITGARPTLYRPTWGMMNGLTRRLLRGYRIVLWTVMVGDWQARAARLKVKDRLQQHMRGGDVVVLHDSGETFGADSDAPNYMIEALDAVLVEVGHHGYKWVTVEDMMREDEKRGAVKLSWQKRLVVALWMQWETLFAKLYGVKTFDEQNPFLHYRVRKYQGSPISLEDGTEIRKGDKIAELHLDNEMLLHFSAHARSSMKVAIQMIRHMAPLMPLVAERFACDPEFADVKGIYGVTIINRGVQQFGFTVLELEKSVFSFFTNLYLKLLLSVLHPSGKQRLRERTEKLVPKMIIVTRAELIRRYPPQQVYPSTARELAVGERKELLTNEL
ncbi:MAG: polysaccharide deacetylase family protein [Tumebacillaceae bacterium]